MGNYDGKAVASLFSTEGYYDVYNCNKTTLVNSQATVSVRRQNAVKNESNYIYEFIICPTLGFLGSPEPLMKDCELKLSFARTSYKNSIIEVGTVKRPCTKLEIKDVVAYTEYVSSSAMENYFSQIDISPLIYEYDECEVLIKNIPRSETTIRFDNLKGGSVPRYLFAAVIPQAALDGSLEKSSTFFHHQNVEEFNITLNGKLDFI